MFKLPISQKIISKFHFLTIFLPKIRGLVFLSRPFFKFTSAKALVRFGTKDIPFEMDLNQEYELGVFLSNKHELAVAYVITKLSKKYELSSFIDIGANVGWVSRLVANFGNLDSIYSFEPNQKAFKRLKEFSTAIKPINYVVSNKSGDFFEMNTPTRFSGPTSSYFTKTVSQNAATKIQSISLNDFLARENKCADIIKIDAEGAEISILKGAEGVVLENALFVIIEIEEYTLERYTFGNVEDVYSLMENYGFIHYYNIISSSNSIFSEKRGATGDILFAKKALDLNLFTTWEE